MALRPLGSPRVSVPPAETSPQPQTALARVEPVVVHVAELLPPALPPPVLLPPVPKGKPKVVGPTALKHGARVIDALIMSGCDAPAARVWIQWLLVMTAGKTPPVKDGVAPALAAIMQLYVSLFEQQHGELPHVAAADYALATKLLRKHGPQALTEKLNALAALDDPFIKQQGFTFGTLSRNWNRLAAQTRRAQKIAHRSAPPDCQHEPRCQTAQEHAQRWIHDVRGSRSSVNTLKRPTTSTPSAPSSEP